VVYDVVFRLPLIIVVADGDTVEVVQNCAFECDRKVLIQRITYFDPDDLVLRMLKSPDAWIEPIRFAEYILTAEKELKLERKASHGVASSSDS